MLPKPSLFVFLILLLAHGAVAAQSPQETDVAKIVTEAAAAVESYVGTFKNLLSRETKTIESYDSKGHLRKRRTIVSNFIVYQLPSDPNRMAEYRHVIEVGGKPLPNATRRAEEFFESLVKASSSQTQLARLRNESSRFDGEILISGLTLFQSVVLSENLRPFFEFKLKGIDNPNSGPRYVITYQQVRPSADIVINSEAAREPGRSGQSVEMAIDEDGPLNARLRGELHIDAASYRILREVRETTIQPAGFLDPMVVMRNEFEYGPSDFGIFTPKRLTHVQYSVRAKQKAAFRELSVTFEYDRFTRPDVEVKSSEVTSHKP